MAEPVANSKIFPNVDPIIKTEIAVRDAYQLKLYREQQYKDAEHKFYLAKAKHSRAKGNTPARLSEGDVYGVLVQVLTNLKGSIKNAYRMYASQASKPKDWADKVYNFNMTEQHQEWLKTAIERMKEQGEEALEYAHIYEELDLKKIGSSSTLRKGLKIMKVQIETAEKLFIRDSLISKQQEEIAELKAKIQLLTPPQSWEEKALELKRIGLSVSAISVQVGRSRPYVSTYLNKNKDLWAK